MKKSKMDQNDPVILKQKLIYYQSELSLYKERLKRYENMTQVNKQKELEQELEYRNSEILKLQRIIHELEAENVILKEVSVNKNEEQKYAQDLENQLSELQGKLAELEKKKKLEAAIALDDNRSPNKQNNFSNSWFINNLKNQQAVIRSKPVPYKNLHFPSTPTKQKAEREDKNE